MTDNLSDLEEQGPQILSYFLKTLKDLTQQRQNKGLPFDQDQIVAEAIILVCKRYGEIAAKFILNEVIQSRGTSDHSTRIDPDILIQLLRAWQNGCRIVD